MLKTSTEFPQVGSHALLKAGRKRVRITQRNADGTLLVSGGNTTKTVRLDELLPIGSAMTRGSAQLSRGAA
ncbi:hypothetical protein [Tardibacter chloracetimidivorans]|nr:hypothetical protein [Tardibacter chloracetimidivorans]